MGNSIMINHISPGELQEMLDITVLKNVEKVIDKRDYHKRLSRRRVSKEYLKENFGWSRRKIEKFISEGKLEKTVSLNNAKVVWFDLRQCEELYESIKK